MANLPLMPRATAVWLVESTTLSFEQIAKFCGMHPLEVQGIADGDVAGGVIGQDPVAKGQLDGELLKEAEKDPTIELKLNSDFDQYLTTQKKHKKRYTPVARRQDKPDAVAWLVKNHPEITDAQIGKLIGTTKNTISAIREREHWNIQNIRPRDPVLLGLCTQTDLQMIVDKLEKNRGRDLEKMQREAADMIKQDALKKTAKSKKDGSEAA